MERLKINSEYHYIEKNSKPFFLLSDTNWMAFQKISVNDFRELVRLRKEQGFTSLQISVLPIAHDNSKSDGDIEPFMLKDGRYDFNHINEIYFDRACEMLEIMNEYEIIPFLHLFWVNYIPDTWAAKKSPDTVIPIDKLETICEYIIKRFKIFAPIYSVSGDTCFETELVIEYYKIILDIIQKMDPEGITTLHLQPYADPPDVLINHPKYNFYTYQSGHGRNQTLMIDFSKQFLNKQVKKPIINSEPCYEGHGYGGEYGRFFEFDIRKAIWSSLLSGARAGVTYGAHGLWQFYDIGTPFNGVQFSSLPYGRRTAVNFPGAWDVGFAKWIFEKYDMFKLIPNEDLVEPISDIIRVACDESKIVIYLPYNHDITVLKNLEGYSVDMFALGSRRIMNPWLTFYEYKTVIHMCECNEDILIVAEK